MKHSSMKGFSFGLTSGVITTLGMMVGLNSSTSSIKIVIAGILIIAVADSLSDAVGVHISEESEKRHTNKEIWEATIATFFSKLFFSLFFVIPFLFLPLPRAIVISIIIGLFLILIFSYYIAKEKQINPREVILEHLAIAIFVIVATNYLGKWINNF